MLRAVRAEVTVEIERSPEDVFSYLTDVSNLPHWQAGVQSAELDGEPRRGARIRESRRLLGRELHTMLAIEDYEPPRLFTLRALDSPVPFTVRHELEPSAGGTRLTVVGEGETGLLPGFATGLIARRAERQFHQDFERLKTLLEG
jgi:carbon monoxide dehydrogenase subunit G